MEDEYPIKEIKVMDGVYLWKPEKKNIETITQNKEIQQFENNSINNKEITIGENKYLCNGQNELIKIYEIEFEELGDRVQALFQSNEDMLEFDPYDYDLIQAREENLQLIDKKLEEMKKIQIKMKEICNYHPIVSVDIFEYFGIGKKEKEENTQINKKLNKIVEIKGNENKENKENDKTQKILEGYKEEGKNKIVTEIEL